MILYRIYTEDRCRNDIIEYMTDFFDGFTLYTGTGYWRGQAESCLVIEIIGAETDDLAVRGVATWIKCHNAQESVAVTKQAIVVETIGEQI